MGMGMSFGLIIGNENSSNGNGNSIFCRRKKFPPAGNAVLVWERVEIGMIRWEWEGNGNKKVIPTHL